MNLLKYNQLLTLKILFIIPFYYSCTEETRVEQGYALGTSYLIKYKTDKNTDIEAVKDDIEAVFDTINKSMSIHLPTSDISAINKGDTNTIIDEHFYKVFTKAKEVWKNTDGYFDPTVGILVNAWGFGPENNYNSSVTEKQIDSLKTYTGFHKVTLTENNKVLKENPAIYIDFNALAKGYTIDLIGEKLMQHGIYNYIIELGGEVLARGINSKNNKNWIVAIDSPEANLQERKLVAKVKLMNKAIATSGNYRKYRVDELTGDHYVHILNPHTGYPQKSEILSVSVIADTCMEADAYATALMVIPINKAKELLYKTPEIEAYIISSSGNTSKREVFYTEGFKTLLLKEKTIHSN